MIFHSGADDQSIKHFYRSFPLCKLACSLVHIYFLHSLIFFCIYIDMIFVISVAEQTSLLRLCPAAICYSGAFGYLLFVQHRRNWQQQVWQQTTIKSFCHKSDAFVLLFCWNTVTAECPLLMSSGLYCLIYRLYLLVSSVVSIQVKLHKYLPLHKKNHHS